VIVVDSSVWIANLRDLDIEAVRKLRSIESLGEILVGDLILLEVLQGARDEDHAARIERSLREFTIAPMLDAELAVKAARHYRSLRRAGITIRKTIDMIIATFCIEGGHFLLHDDRDFDPIVSRLGLRLA
jgi:predicted nucleic acid-binding protein